MNTQMKRGLAAATAVTGLGLAALQIGNASAITDWHNFGHSEAHVRGTEGRRSINDIRSTTNRNPERLRFVIHAPAGINVNPGTARWGLHCWNEFDGREATNANTLVVNDRVETRNLSDRVPGGVDSYQFCELRLDVRQGNVGNVETFLQARYP